MTMFIAAYVKGCPICQQNKVNTHFPSYPLLPIKSEATRPFQQISMDFITDLSLSQGYDSILVIVDQGLTKMGVFIPCLKTITSEETADLIHQNIYRRFGLMDTIISDRGPQFASKVFQAVGRLLGINLRMSTALDPQTDGQTEHTNQTLEGYV